MHYYLVAIILAFSFTSCSQFKDKKIVASTYQKDTLYTQKLSSTMTNIALEKDLQGYEKTYKPSVQEIQQKSLVDESVAKEWIRNGKSVKIHITEKHEFRVIPFLLTLFVSGIVLWLAIGWLFTKSIAAFRG